MKAISAHSGRPCASRPAFAPDRLLKGLLFFLFLLIPALAAQAQGNDTAWQQQVQQILGQPGQQKPGGVLRFAYPRTDLNVTINGIPALPETATDGYAAFKRADGDRFLLIGELALLEDQVNPAIEVLKAGGLQATAVHNHFLKETPRLIFLHLSGVGDASHLAQVFLDTLNKVGYPHPNDDDTTDADDQVSGFDTKRVEQIIGHSGDAVDGVFEIDIGRAEQVTYHSDKTDQSPNPGVQNAEPTPAVNTNLPADMGPETELNFQPIGNGKVIAVSEIATTAAEVNPVVRVLRESGQTVTAIHNHFLFEQPRLFWVHSFAIGDPYVIAAQIRKALDQTNAEKSDTGGGGGGQPGPKRTPAPGK